MCITAPVDRVIHCSTDVFSCIACLRDKRLCTVLDTCVISYTIWKCMNSLYYACREYNRYALARGLDEHGQFQALGTLDLWDVVLRQLRMRSSIEPTLTFPLMHFHKINTVATEMAHCCMPAALYSTGICQQRHRSMCFYNSICVSLHGMAERGKNNQCVCSFASYLVC